MIQPPKMSPLALESAGIGITRITSSRSVGQARRRGAVWFEAAAAVMRRFAWHPRRLPSSRVPRFFHDPASDAIPRHGPAPACRSRSRHAALRLGNAGASCCPTSGATACASCIALAFLVGAKVANVGVPLLLKSWSTPWRSSRATRARCWWCRSGCCWPTAALRLSTSLFTELRELIFAKATEGTARSISLQVFRHLHALSLRFHLERQTGGMTRDIERGTRAVQSLDLLLALQHRADADRGDAGARATWRVKFDAWFAGITLSALVVYITSP